jgi:PAS domain S-box-containing protein
LLKERSNLAEASERRTVWVTFSGSLAAFGLIIVAGIAIRNDTRERERVEEELRQSEARFRLLVERVGDYAIFMVDPAGLVASWNAGAERIKGYRENEILGRHFSCFYSGEDQDAGKPQMELRVAASEGGFEDEGWRIRKDGSRFWANVVITALRDPHERLLGFSKITRDLTDRRKIEEDVRKLNLELQARNAELARSNADLQQFAYVASHDLQEPLRMVISYLQILTEQYKGKLGADADEFIGYAVDGGYRMRQLITDLLEYSRVGTSDEKPVPTECGAVLEEVRANLDLAIRESSAVITCDPDPLPIVVADPSQMLQLFQNLIGNAIKFRGTRVPRISVSARRDGRHWLFSVADNGIGIEPEHQESIFLIFRRLHGRMEYPGTGIGLAICKKIVDQLGGRIWVESEPGKGSTFFFTVAAIAEDEAALEEARDGERN